MTVVNSTPQSTAQVSSTGSTAYPRADSTPEEVSQWWSDQTKTIQKTCMQNDPQYFGNLDGIPAEDRHEANMYMLEHDAWHGDEGAIALQKEIRNNDDMYLLGYEPVIQTKYTALGPYLVKDRQNAIISVGNPDTADNIATVVPGMNTEFNENGVHGAVSTLENLQKSANAADGESSTATVYWMGYDIPQGGEAMSGTYAEKGAPALSRFMDGLAATHKGPAAHTTVIGYSYGGVVTGTAGALNKHLADDIVIVGPRGVGTDTQGEEIDDESDMNVSQENFWVGQAKEDKGDGFGAFGNDSGYHGENPVHFVEKDNYFATEGANGHGDYFKAGTESLTNLGRIITGEYDDVTVQSKK